MQVIHNAYKEPYGLIKSWMVYTCTFKVNLVILIFLGT